MVKIHIIISLIILGGAVIAATIIDEPTKHPFELDAVYKDGIVNITFIDHSEQSQFVSMEILGMKETFRRVYNNTSFMETVHISEPQYGWSAHPIVIDITHQELGDVQLKTEIRPQDEPPSPLIYGPR